MSESSAFANYSNTVQQLTNSVDQEQPTTRQVTDNAKQFESEFLVGAALTAKTKATEKFVGMIRKSKTVKKAIGKSKDEIERLAKKGFQDARQQVKDQVSRLQNRVVPKPTDSTPPPPQSQPPAPDDLKPLEDAKEAADKQLDATNKAKQLADDEVENSAADAEAARDTEATAKQVSKKALSDAVKSNDGAIGSDVTNARLASIEATKNRIAQEARSEKAISEQTRIEQQVAQHTSDAERAGADLRNAQESQEAASAASSAQSIADAGGVGANADADAEAAAKEAEEAARIAKLAKAEKAAKDVEEASVAEDEADPIGFLVTAAAAAATQLIGRKIQAQHQVSTGVKIPLSYTSTPGA